MKNLTTSQIRTMWLEFFASHGHHIEESKSVVPYEDKSILFINSGVATIKDYFDGTKKPISTKIVNSQKAIRTNDIENVGLTSRHHTLFEMLGNFSIGDYFKHEAIDYAWELLTDPKWFAFDPAKLYVTVHPDDTASFEQWIKVGIDPTHIVKLEENFWEIGKGPGGPNTEIFYDRGESYDTRDVIGLLAEDLENDRIIEIWNIVFSQFNCDPENLKQSEYLELPQKNIDTGMGLERMACVMQDVETNFETDTFAKIIESIASLTDIGYADAKMSYRVIADHVRALVFAIADGALPSNDGRGYVLRRILRRAVKYGYLNLGFKDAFLFKIVDSVVSVMNDFYPYLNEHVDYVKKVIKAEEIRFFATLEDGLKLLDVALVSDLKVLPADIAFSLYDTYGFPIEITIEICELRGCSVDTKGFEDLLQQQRERARAGAAQNGAINFQNAYLSSIDLTSEFLGYSDLKCDATITLITDLESDVTAKIDETVYVMTDKTVFYALSGGQSGDTGFINQSPIINTIKLPSGQNIHQVKCCEEFTTGQVVSLAVDVDRRGSICQNHSVTHLLHLALHKLVSQNATQAGSSQDEFRTRFDFSSFDVIDDAKLCEIEDFVNAQIKANHICEIEEMDINAAKEMGAMALFGEKYQDLVRVVKMGDSVELCGGTHVNATQEIESFHILSQSSIGSGIKRIEAITGSRVLSLQDTLASSFDASSAKLKLDIENKKVINLTDLEIELQKLTKVMRVLGSDISAYKAKYELLVTSNNELKSSLNANREQVLVTLAKDLIANGEMQDDVLKIDAMIDVENIGEFRTVGDLVCNMAEKVVVILRFTQGEKVSIVVKVSDSITSSYNANLILKEIITPLGGRGGGKPNMAQGGY